MDKSPPGDLPGRALEFPQEGLEPPRRHRIPMPPRRTIIAAVASLAAIGLGLGLALDASRRGKQPLPAADGTVSIALDRPISEFQGNRNIGAGVDGLEQGGIDRVWRPSSIEAMRSAGFGPISYRLRTELGAEAWHWNPQGSWSEPNQKQGYWTSSSQPKADYPVSYGYRLPRRGNTTDQAKDDGFSRLDDGDTKTYWKSNPYLDPHYTGEPDDRHPQWVMVAFPSPVPVDSLRLDWGTPHATRIKVQYWTGHDALVPVDGGQWKGGRWRDFPLAMHVGAGGTQTVVVAPKAVNVQNVRILLTKGSATAPAGATDIRDRLGVALRELYVGQQKFGKLTDHIHHAPSQKQTAIWTSSTDPWHRAQDLDKNYEHVSFERLFASGITNGEPAMVPVPALYGVPEDAAAMIRYLKKRGYPFSRIEIGEEPNGQLTQPEHYGALYLQMARAVKAVDSSLEFGGPGYQTTLPDWEHWPDTKGKRSWTGRFVSYLKDHGAMQDLDFFSFEWYPFDDVCAEPSGPLAQSPGLLRDLLARQEKAGLPPGIPKIITEYGYSAFAGQIELELPGAIFNAETAAMFLKMGGETSYYYGLEPNTVIQEGPGEKCNSWGNLMLLQVYDNVKLRPLASYHAVRLMNRQWLEGGNGQHSLYSATSDVRDGAGDELVTAYPVRRPDGRLSVLLFNKDPKRALTVRLIQDSGGRHDPIPGEIHLTQYSSKQYKWNSTKGSGDGGKPDPNEPPEQSTIDAGKGATVTLPPQSISLAVTER